MRDLFNSIDVRRVISPLSVSDNTSQQGQIIDRRGFNSVCYVIATGGLADAAAQFVTLLEDSDASDMAGAYAVVDDDMHGTEAAASFTQDSDDGVFKLGYRGSKRYTRLTITPLNNASAALFCVMCVLGK